MSAFSSEIDNEQEYMDYVLFGALQDDGERYRDKALVWKDFIKVSSGAAYGVDYNDIERRNISDAKTLISIYMDFINDGVGKVIIKPSSYKSSNISIVLRKNNEFFDRLFINHVSNKFGEGSVELMRNQIESNAGCFVLNGVLDGEIKLSYIGLNLSTDSKSFYNCLSRSLLRAFGFVGRGWRDGAMSGVDSVFDRRTTIWSKVDRRVLLCVYRNVDADFLVKRIGKDLDCE
jgi:hypothetical protein